MDKSSSLFLDFDVALAALAEHSPAEGNVAEGVPDVGAVLGDRKDENKGDILDEKGRDQNANNRNQKHNGGDASCLVEHAFELPEWPHKEKRPINKKKSTPLVKLQFPASRAVQIASPVRASA